MTNTYHVVNATSSPGSWSVSPSGTVVASGIDSDGPWATINFYQSDCSVIFVQNGCSDTLFTQDCCESPPGYVQVKDVSTKNYTINQIAAILGGSVLHPLPSVYIISVTGKNLFIQGEFDLSSYSTGDDYHIIFDQCNIKMGIGSVMYGSQYVFGESHVEGVCGMWQGIKVKNHGTINAENSTFKDAEYCMSIYDVELRVRLKNSLFTRNFVSIYSPSSTPENSFSYSINPAFTSYIEECIFDGADPIILPPYRGQWGIPQGGKSFAGMFLNNLTIPVLGGSAFDRIFLIPFSNDPAFRTTFSNLHYGIYGVNSNMEVFNCTFSNIQPDPAYNLRRGSEGGCAIFSKAGVNTAVKFLKVGEQNDAVRTLNFQNEFIDCRRGVKTENGINSFINFNTFLHPFNTSNPSGTGIYLKDADLRQISIRNNTFTEEKYNPDGPYSSTGIAVSSLMPTYKNLHIADNIFTNERVGVYLQNSRGRTFSDMGFMVEDNLFVSNVDPNELASYNGIFGIWLNNVSKGMVRYNQFYRPIPLNMEPANYQTMVYGMNVVGTTDMNIAGNDFTQYGTSMRMVSNCAGTTLKCNTMTANVQGISLAMANMTAQGWPGEAWDNKWDGFPYASATTHNRVDGTSPNVIKWYNQGLTNDGGYYNRYSPEPVDYNIIWPTPQQNSPGCYFTTSYPGDVEGRNDRIRKIIEGEMEYTSFPEETKYLDQEFVYQALKEDTLLRDSDPEFKNFYDSLEVVNFGKFEEVGELYKNGELVEALTKLDIIVEESEIEYNKKYTHKVFLNQKESGNEEMEPEVEEELHGIAWTNAWEGGCGVFGARHLLEEQVFDLERNLRVRGPAKKQETASVPVQFSIYPNPAGESVTFFHNAPEDASISAQVYDLSGRMVLENSISGNKLNIQNLTEGIYILHLNVNQEFYSMVKLTVLK